MQNNLNISNFFLLIFSFFCFYLTDIFFEKSLAELKWYFLFLIFIIQIILSNINNIKVNYFINIFVLVLVIPFIFLANNLNFFYFILILIYSIFTTFLFYDLKSLNNIKTILLNILFFFTCFLLIFQIFYWIDIDNFFWKDYSLLNTNTLEILNLLKNRINFHLNFNISIFEFLKIYNIFFIY